MKHGIFSLFPNGSLTISSKRSALLVEGKITKVQVLLHFEKENPNILRSNLSSLSIAQIPFKQVPRVSNF